MIISPKLDEFVKKDGRSKVYIYLYDPKTRTKAKVPTEFYIKPTDWTGSQVDKKQPHANYINPKINQIVLDLENYYLKHPGITAKQLKEAHDTPKQSFTPASYFRHYIQLCKDGTILKKTTKEKMTEGYLKALGTSAAYLEKFPCSWSDLGEDFYDSYVIFLRSQRLKQNTIAKTVKHLLAIAKHAKSKGIHANDKLQYFVKTEKAQKIRLTTGEVERMLNLDLSDWPELKAEQDRFHVAYSLMVRFGDSISINEKNIVSKNGKYFLSAFTQKTRKQILLPIKPSVYKILKANNFNLKSSNSKSNEKLKRIGMMAKVNTPVTFTEFRNGQKIETVYKKYQKIETHTTRRSAARNLFDAGLDPDIIQVLGGWSSRKQMLEYIDIDLDYAASKAAEHPFFN